MQASEVDIDDLIGMVAWQGEWHCFAAPVAYWILDYISYDPGLDPDDPEEDFRNQLFVVEEGKAPQFLAAMEEWALTFEVLKTLLEQDGPECWRLAVVVDFDRRLLVNGFGEVPIHDYLPPGWTGVEDFTLPHVPETIRALWTSHPSQEAAG